MDAGRSSLRVGIVALVVGTFACDPMGAPPTPPSFSEVRSRFQPSDQRLLDRHGRTLHVRRVDPTERRLAWTPLSAFSPALLEVIVAAEDKRLRTHNGVDVAALANAALSAARGKRRGGSTITMQLVALIEPSLGRAAPGPARRKLRQLRAAWQLEREWTKDQILEAYLNLVPLRGELRGIPAAAALSFELRADALTRAHAVAIAALLPAPNAPAATVAARAKRLATRLAHVDREDLDRAVAQVTQGPRAVLSERQAAPHVAVRLLNPEGTEPVRTTLDLTVQRVATANLDQHLRDLLGQGVRDGAVLVADNASGEVLAYVGSSGALSEARHVDGVRAPRQAGSTLKPFLYAAALDQRHLTATSLLDDTPLELFLGVGSYRPSNYDDRFFGPLPLRVALATSRNIPAVRTLDLVGGEAFLQRLHAAGFASLRHSAEHYGPGLALGSGEVTLWELVDAYRTLANGGLRTPLRLTLGDDPRTAAPTRVFGVEAAFIVADILADREARSGAFGLDGALTTSFWAAVKTGTSTDMRDNWCIGFSPRYTVGVWVGNFSGAPMGDVSGVTGAAPVWADLLRWLHREAVPEPPRPPDGVVAAAVTLPSGRETTEWFLRGTEPATDRIRVARPADAIVAPVDGALLALDPGIPEANQRVAFVSSREHASLEWWLGDTRLGTTVDRVLWRPVPGEHRLELRATSGAVVDRVRFRVR